MRRITPFFPFFVLLVSHFSLAISYPLPPEGSRLVGQPVTIAVPQNNTQPLESFAARYGQGLSNMLEANPGVDVFLPQSGSTLVVPQQLILPDTVREGIVVNVAEMRLYYYPAGTNTVEVLPIGIGQAGRETPRLNANKMARFGCQRLIRVGNMLKREKRCPRWCLRGRITLWGYTQYISAGYMPSMALMLTLALAFASVRAVSVYAMTILNIYSTMFL